MTADEVEDLSEYGDLFKEPDDYYPAEKPATFAEHVLESGQLLKLRLVGHNPLWGHLLWNGGRVVSNYLEANADQLVVGRNVLEFGAGAGLPSLVCAVTGAQTVVVTDYPDPELIENLRSNIRQCSFKSSVTNITAEGFLWGSAADHLKAHLPDAAAGFDLLILADLLFNHSEHQKLVASMQATLKRTASARALVFFTPYRPWLLEKDLAFFDYATAGGFYVEKILEVKQDEVMFEHDRGDEALRRTVFGYELRWAEP